MDASEFVSELDPAQRDDLIKALGVSGADVELSADELDETIEELKKGMDAPDWDQASTASEIDVTGYLSEVVDSLQKGMGGIYDAQDVLAKGMCAVVEAVQDLRDQVYSARCENDEIRKSLRLPEPRRSAEHDVVPMEPPGEQHDLTIGEASDLILKAIQSENDPIRRDLLAKALTDVELGRPLGPDTLRELGIA